MASTVRRAAPDTDKLEGIEHPLSAGRNQAAVDHWSPFSTQPRHPEVVLNRTILLHLQRHAGNDAVRALLDNEVGDGQGRRTQMTVQREHLPDDPHPTTEDGEQPGLFDLSDEGLEFIKRHEGVRLKLYDDSQGHCTIGIGHLVHKGNCDGTESEKFKKGLTNDEVTDMFRDDLGKYMEAVSNAITSRINQYEFDALVSFTFNVGIGAFQSSGVLKQVNAKKYSKVPGEMMKWIKPPEIKGRRSDEAKLFRSGQY